MITPALFLLPALAFASPLAKRDSPIITIIDAQTSGTGCPQGTVSTTYSPDGQVVTFGFDAFTAYQGPGYLSAEKSKACQLHLNLKYPSGFQYAVTDSVYHGYARLDKGVTGTFLSTYFFSQDASKTTTTRASISGATWLNGNVYTKEDKIESAVTIWSPCGATGILNVNNRIQLSGTGAGELSDDDATVRFTQQLHVGWQACTPGGGTGGGEWGVGGGSAEVAPRDPEPEADAEAEAQDNSWVIGPGTVVITHPRDAEAETGEDAIKKARDDWGIGPGDVTLNPGGGSTSPGDTWTIGPGGVTITHPKE